MEWNRNSVVSFENVHGHFINIQMQYWKLINYTEAMNLIGECESYGVWGLFISCNERIFNSHLTQREYLYLQHFLFAINITALWFFVNRIISFESIRTHNNCPKQTSIYYIYCRFTPIKRMVSIIIPSEISSAAICIEKNPAEIASKSQFKFGSKLNNKHKFAKKSPKSIKIVSVF